MINIQCIVNDFVTVTLNRLNQGWYCGSYGKFLLLIDSHLIIQQICVRTCHAEVPEMRGRYYKIIKWEGNDTQEVVHWISSNFPFI